MNSREKRSSRSFKELQEFKNVKKRDPQEITVGFRSLSLYSELLQHLELLYVRVRLRRSSVV